jgi:SAM-dependent methyltransferase
VRRSITDLLLKTLLYVYLPFAVLACAFAYLQTVAPDPTIAPLASTAALEPVQQPQRSDRIDRPTSEPYTGSLSIFEDPNRDQRLQLNRIMDLLGIKEGANVADIGAGSGWFSVRAAKRVGTRGTVFAVEINNEYVKHIEKRSKDENLPNIRAVLGKEDDPLLPQKSVDAVLLLKTYHEIREPVRLLKRTREAMRPGALLGIIDRNGNGEDHGIDQQIVMSEAERAGFAFVEQHDFVKADDVHYFLIFRAR